MSQEKKSENPENFQKSEKQKKSLLKSGLLLSLMTFASRIMGLLRETTKASFLGTSMHADAFSTAFMIPNLFRRLFAENAISVAFIPTFKSYLEKGDDAESKKSTQEFLKATFTLISFLTACVVIIGIIVAPLLTPLFCKKPADDYANQIQAWLLKKEEITILTRIMFPYLFVISVAAFFQGILNGCKIFAPSGFTPVLFNGIVILATYLFSPLAQNPARAMALGVIIGGCVQALFQWPFIKQTGWKICFTSLKKTFKNPGTKKVISLVVPTIIGMAAYQLNDVVSTSLANRAGDGIASSLQYSLRLQELILGIFAVSIGTVILPDLSGLASARKWKNFNDMVIQSVKIMTLISVPVTFYSLLSGKELISLLYKSKNFDDASVSLTLGEFKFHIAGLLFIALNRIISPAFYAQGNTKLPTLAGIVSFGANIVLALAFVKPFGGKGIAAALSLASFVNTIFLFVFMKKTNSFEIRRIIFQTLAYVAKITIFSIVATVPSYFVRDFLIKFFENRARIFSFGIPVFGTAIIFAAIGTLELVVAKDEIVYTIVKKISSKKGKK